MAGSLAKQVRLFGRTQGLIPDQTIGNRKTGTTHIPIAEHCPHHVPEQVICPPYYKQYFLAGRTISTVFFSTIPTKLDQSLCVTTTCVSFGLTGKSKLCVPIPRQSPLGRRCQPGCAQSDRKHDQQRDQDLNTHTHKQTNKQNTGTVMNPHIP